MRLCKDCIHYKRSYTNDDFAQCLRRLKIETDPVHGREIKTGIKYCSLERDRYPEENDRCGPEGKYFVEQEWSATRDARENALLRKRRWWRLFDWMR